MHNYHNPYTSYWYKETQYPTKWAAAQAALSDGVPLTLVFDHVNIRLGGQQEFFFGVDTTQEPRESWEDLLRDRAQFLRDSLPCINIMFSGGSDSWLMLETFLLNNIKVDKIIVERFIPKVDSHLNFEQNNSAITLLKDLNLKGAQVIISDWDDINIWSDSALDINSYFETGIQLFPNMGDVAYKLSNRKNNEGEPVIRGTNSPIIYFEEGKCRSEMWDSDNWTGAYMFPYVIPFFTDANYPKLHLKQLHLTKNYFKKHQLTHLRETTTPHKYKEAYLQACRYTSPDSVKVSPFHIKKEKSYNLLKSERLSKHLTKKKIRFYSSLTKDDENILKVLQGVLGIKLGGTPISFLPSFLRVYDVPLE